MPADRICEELERRRARGDSFERLLSGAVELLHERNPRFAWTGIYELIPDNVLRLGPFVGTPTDHVFIGVGRGLCGSAVAQKRNLNTPDVSKVDNYLVCTPETRSELVVLIRRGDRIYAQIDVDSHEVGAFDDASVRMVECVADWLAEVYERREGGGSPS